MKYWFIVVSLFFGPALQAQTNSWDGTAVSIQFNNLTEIDFNINEIESSFTRYAFEAYVQDKTFLPVEALSENRDYCRLTLNIKTELGSYGSPGVSVKFDSSYNQQFKEEMVLGEHRSFETDTPKIRTVVWGAKGATPGIQWVTCFSQDLNKNPHLEKIFPDTMNVRILR
jgi:hypothetical protein